MKKLFSLVVSLVMLATMAFAPAVYAADETDSVKTVGSGSSQQTASVTTKSTTRINPLYQDVVDESDLLPPEQGSSQEPEAIPRSKASGDEYFTTVEAAAAAIRAQLKQRSRTIEIKYRSAGYEGGEEELLFDGALEHTGVPTEGDYLKWQYAGWQASTSYINSAEGCSFTITYTVTYYTAAAQEQEMDSAVSALLTQLNLSGKSQYDRAKIIYDYLCENISYDYANLNDSTYLLKFTAYAALQNKTAVCQGYAVLFYRLALEAGLQARVISGTGNGGPHAWNIVRLGSACYNLDATWDAGSSTYRYFLKGSDTFEGHTRDADYRTSEFQRVYPMASGDYDAANTGSVLIDLSGKTATLSQTAYAYNGSARRPAVTVSGVAAGNYTVAYSNNIYPGTAKVTITGTGNYTGRIVKTFTIRRPVVAAQKTVTIQLYGHDDIRAKWNSQKVAGATVRYKVDYKKYGGSWVTLSKGTTAASLKKANLADGVRYAFRVTPYVTVNGQSYYGTAKSTGYLYTLKKISTPRLSKGSARYVKVKWTNIPGETGYQIYRSKYKNKKFAKVKTVGAKYSSAKIKTAKTERIITR